MEATFYSAKRVHPSQLIYGHYKEKRQESMDEKEELASWMGNVE